MIDTPSSQTGASAQSGEGRVFCTYFDSRYLARGLALYRSLFEVSRGMSLWILCLDQEVYAALRELALPSVRLIPLQRLEEAYPELLELTDGRNRLEYYFTLTPFLPLFVLRSSDAPAMITYVDADTFFFSNPEPLFDELGTESVGLTEHRFPSSSANRGAYGRFNVGWLTFRNDSIGRNALQWWRRRCLEWCFDRIEPGRFADQKYLDEFPALFGAAVLNHPGANVAPWNVAGLALQKTGSELTVDGQPLIFFHFHGLRRLAKHVWQLGLVRYRVRRVPSICRELFRHYLALVTEAEYGRDHTAGTVEVPLSRPRTLRAWLSIPLGFLLGDIMVIRRARRQTEAPS
jgi:hypothetical protein